jgi:ribulose-phosphate 3-epimerase
MLRPEDIWHLHWDLPIDVHLMARRPSEYFQTIFVFEKVQAIAFHVECDEDIHETITLLRNAGKRVGIWILDTTPADHLDPYLLEIDYVVVMTIKWWYSGTPFIPEVLKKITEIHNKSPELPIIVDGGIGEKALPLCEQAGATGAVMSSALFGESNISWLQ